MSVIYRSYSDLGDDIRRWCNNLTVQVAGVSGVPRSGLLCAAIMAEELHVPYIPIESLAAPDRLVYRPQCSRKLFAINGPILVLDDTSWGGRTMKQVQSTLTASNIIYGAVYGSDKAMAEGAINIRGYHLPDINHTFAWNLMRDCMTRHILTDMDGVVCEDWGKPDTGEWLARYEDFLDNAAPLKKPWKSPLAIVTARLEKYRRKTEVWLRKHQIPCKQLIMAPYATVEERQKNDGFAGRKAQIYLEMKDRARLFIESCPRQSRIIAERTKMPVLSFTEHRLYNGVEPQPAW